MPDFYAEPGRDPFRDPFRDPVQGSVNESIDPYSGVLHLSHTDIFIPGNGGLDITVQRVYNSSNIYLSRPAGLATTPPFLTARDRLDRPFWTRDTLARSQ